MQDFRKIFIKAVSNILGNVAPKNENLDLLIIDDFGMKKLEGQQQNDFEQIIDDRYHKKIVNSL